MPMVVGALMADVVGITAGVVGAAKLGFSPTTLVCALRMLIWGRVVINLAVASSGITALKDCDPGVEGAGKFGATLGRDYRGFLLDSRTTQASWGHAIYRSTPYLPMAVPLSNTHSRYASTQNLSDSYVQLPGAYSPLYSPSVASLCSSYEPPPPLPLRPRPISTTSIFSRSRSDDNILNSIDAQPKARRLPPPPPPIDAKRSLKPPIPTPTENTQVSASTSKTIPVPSPAKTTQAQVNGSTTTGKAESSTSPPTIDIHALREKSKNLDLPLIAALCNDRQVPGIGSEYRTAGQATQIYREPSAS
uniref:Uncharacterized protein n=1 Tax=Phlebotomus papatasi TaxID=29031 RepID=A0A1B0D365_PHLPP